VDFQKIYENNRIGSLVSFITFIKNSLLPHYVFQGKETH